MGGKQAVRIKQVVYTLSPFQQSVMSGLFKDIPSKLSKKISENKYARGGLGVRGHFSWCYRMRRRSLG